MIASQIFSGVGVGLLIGVLLGLSASPTVGVVVGAVSGLLASLIGSVPALGGDRDQGAAMLSVAGLRAGAFGVSCVLAVLLGLYLRTHNVLSPPAPTLEERFEEYRSIGFDDDAARQLAVAGGTTGTVAVSDGAPGVGDSVLFSLDADQCERLHPDRFASFTALTQTYRAQQLDSLLRISELVDRHVADEGAKMALMTSITEALCETP